MAQRTAKTSRVTVQAAFPIRMEIKPDTPAYYVNYMSVSQTPYDFTISVTRIPSQLTDEQAVLARRGEPIPLEATLQLVVPPLLVEGLIEALTAQKQKYVETLEKAKAKKNEHQQHNTGPLAPVD